MDPSEDGATKRTGRRSRFNSGIVAAGAAFGMTLAGLGIAAAQIDNSTTTTEPAATVAPAPAPEGPRGGPGFGRHHGPGPGLAAAAEAIGVTEEELHTALRSGQSLAQVAESEGVEVQKVVDALVAAARERLAADVAAGRLTQAQADEKTATLTERITAMVNHTGGPRGPGHPRPGGFGGHMPPPPPDGEAPAAEPASITA